MNSINKDIANERRLKLKHLLEKLTNAPSLSKMEIKNKFNFDFPSSIIVTMSAKTLNVAIDSDDKIEAKVSYELDTWAFALMSKLSSIIKNINFYILLRRDYEQLSKIKWFYLFMIRLSYLNKNKPEDFEFNIYTIRTGSLIRQKIDIHKWLDIEGNISFDNIYRPNQLNIRRNKSKHSVEDAEQNEIIKNLQIKNPSAFIFKEFPIFFSELPNYRQSGNRIDIMFTDEKNNIIIEVKVGLIELEVVSQILNYYIFIICHRNYFETQGWEHLKGDKEISCIILCKRKHPMLDELLKMYGQFGFNEIKVIEKTSQGYPGFIIY